MNYSIIYYRYYVLGIFQEDPFPPLHRHPCTRPPIELGNIFRIDSATSKLPHISQTLQSLNAPNCSTFRFLNSIGLKASPLFKIGSSIKCNFRILCFAIPFNISRLIQKYEAPWVRFISLWIHCWNSLVCCPRVRPTAWFPKQWFDAFGEQLTYSSSTSLVLGDHGHVHQVRKSWKWCVVGFSQCGIEKLLVQNEAE